MRYFPINVRLTGQTVILIGGGDDILAKCRLLMKTRAKLNVFAQAANDTPLQRLHDEGKITLIASALTEADCRNATLAYIGAGNNARRDHAMALCDLARVPYCVIDDLERSRFITPALVDRAPVSIAIGTEGTAPVLARRIKAQIEDLVPQHTGLVAKAAGRFRRRLELFDSAHRRRFWERLFGEVLSAETETANSELSEQQVEKAMWRLLGDSRDEASSRHPVHFVSAGPGDPGLMTVKARALLDAADVVIHDARVSASILDLARREALLVETGKTNGHRPLTQQAVNRLMIRHALAGALVVRLKAGNADTNGRLDGEMAALDKAAIAYKITPGLPETAVADARATNAPATPTESTRPLHEERISA